MRGRELIVGHELCSSMDEFSPVADSGSLCPDALATKPQKTCPNSGATSTQKTCPNLKRLVCQVKRFQLAWNLSRKHVRAYHRTSSMRSILCIAQRVVMEVISV